MAECRNVGLLLQQAGQLVEYARVAEWANRTQLHPGGRFVYAYLDGTGFFLSGETLRESLGMSLRDSAEGEVFDLGVVDSEHEFRSQERSSDLGTAAKLALWRAFSGYATDIRDRKGDFTVKQYLAEVVVSAQFEARGLHPGFSLGPAPVERRPEGEEHREHLRLVSSKSDPSVWAVVDPGTEGDSLAVVASHVLAMSVDEVMDVLLRDYPEQVPWRRYPVFETDDAMTAPSVRGVLSSVSAAGDAFHDFTRVFQGRDVGQQTPARLTGGGWFQFGDAAEPWLVWVDGQVFRAGQAGDAPPADGSAFPGFPSLGDAARWALRRHGDALRARLGLGPAVLPSGADLGGVDDDELRKALAEGL